jgi:hypothetical protein
MPSLSWGSDAGQPPCEGGREKLAWKPAWDQYSAEAPSAMREAVRDRLFGAMDMNLEEMRLGKP